MKCPSCGEQLPERGRECPACQADVGWWVRRPEGTAFGPYDLATVHLCINENRVGPGDLARVGAGMQWAPVEALLPEAFLHPEASAPAEPQPLGWAAPSPPPAPPRAERTSPWLTSGIVALVLVLVCGGILAAVAIPAFGSARKKAQQTSCMSNLKQISLGLLMYQQDYSGRFPPSGDWQGVVFPYIRNQQIFTCPAAPQEQGYAYNHQLDGLLGNQVTQPAMTFLGWDAGAAPPGVTPPSGTTPNRHNGGDNFAFADGHVKWLTGPNVATTARTKP